MRIEYHPKAKAEIQHVRKWYDSKVDGLGLEFLLAVKKVEIQLIHSPLKNPFYEGETRRYFMKRFPFSVIYLASEEKIQIVSVAHFRKKPGYWKSRLKK